MISRVVFRVRLTATGVAIFVAFIRGYRSLGKDRK